MSDPYDMDRGIRPKGCICIMTRNPRGLDGNPAVTPEPAEWMQHEDCPVHPYVPHSGIGCDW